MYGLKVNALNVTVGFDVKDVLFGILDRVNISILVNDILLEGNFLLNSVN